MLVKCGGIQDTADKQNLLGSSCKLRDVRRNCKDAGGPLPGHFSSTPASCYGGFIVGLLHLTSNNTSTSTLLSTSQQRRLHDRNTLQTLDSWQEPHFSCLVTMASFPNIYNHRKVADTASKACEICYKPSTSVLVTPENKVHRPYTDHI